MNKNNGIAGGGFLACLAYAIFGLLGLYWMCIKNASPYEILTMRVIFSVFFLGLAVLLFKSTRDDVVIAFKSRKIMLLLLAAAVSIFINWGGYYFCLKNGMVVDASLGFYICPLLQVFIGLIFFKESKNIGVIISLILAVIGVGYLTVMQGIFPYMAVILAVSFAMYSVCKRFITLKPFASLFIEAVWLFPLCLAIVLIMNAKGQIVFGTDVNDTTLMIFSGFVTAIPILIFSLAAQRTSMTMMGFAQFIGTTITFFLGITVFNETLSLHKLIAFIFIWSALIIFMITNYTASKKQRTVKEEK